MKYQAVIFDLDGVICSTDTYHYQAWKAIADELKIPFNETINHRLRGVSRMESFEIILEKYDKEMSREEKVSWTEKKNEIYKELLKNMSPADLSEEVKSTLDALREKGLLLAIGSSSKMQDLSWDSWDLANILMPFLTETTSQNPSRIRKCL